MKVGLIDVDGHNFPNIALMKISAYHKQQGDQVEMLFPMQKYDRVYMSKIFDTTPDYETIIMADEIIRGGRAYDKKLKLPSEIENIYPDYSLYGITNEAYGYLTRACPRGCGFCDVQNIEGKKTYKVAELSQFWNGQKYIKLLDPNILAAKERYELLMQLVKSGVWIDFTQGLDARLLNLRIVELLNKMKIKMLHFAWDNPNDSTVPYMLWHFKKWTNLDFRRLRVYVLTNYNSTHEQDLYRIYKLKELGYDPFVMVYDKEHSPKQTRDMARWVNNKFIFRSCEKFEHYKIT